MSEIYESFMFRSEMDLLSHTFETQLILFQESSDDSESFLDKLIDFLKGIIEKVNEFIDNMIEKAREKFNNMNISKALREIKKHAPDMESKGIKVEYYDVWKYESVFKEFSMVLSHEIKPFTKRSYWKEEMTPEKADKMLRVYEKVCDKYQNQLDTIKNTPIKVSPVKLVEWLDDNWDINRNKSIGELKEYMKTVDETIKTVEDVDKHLMKYSEKTGYTIHAKTVKDHINNATIYMKNNSEWITTTAVAIGLSALKIAIKEIYIATKIGPDKLLDPDYRKSGEPLGMNGTMKQDRAKAKDDYSKNNRLDLVDKALTVGTGSLLTKAAAEKQALKKHGVNSIFKK